MIVALDGPAGSGKSTTARRAAERLGWLYLDTGAMYRAVALGVLRREAAGQGAFDEPTALAVLAEEPIALQPDGVGTRVLLGREDVTEQIRTPEVSLAASRVSAFPGVREQMVEEQRRVARAQPTGVVIEGRDIGTVVFPDAELKVFLDADPAERARRRHAEQPDGPPVEQVEAEIRERDARDRSRAVAPLRASDDAVVLDTTPLSPDEQLQALLELIAEREPGATRNLP